jgi:hypothetical protein
VNVDQIIKIFHLTRGLLRAPEGSLFRCDDGLDWLFLPASLLNGESYSVYRKKGTGHKLISFPHCKISLVTLASFFRLEHSDISF